MKLCHIFIYIENRIVNQWILYLKRSRTAKFWYHFSIIWKECKILKIWLSGCFLFYFIINSNQGYVWVFKGLEVCKTSSIFPFKQFEHALYIFVWICASNMLFSVSSIRIFVNIVIEKKLLRVYYCPSSWLSKKLVNVSCNL